MSQTNRHRKRVLVAALATLSGAAVGVSPGFADGRGHGAAPTQQTPQAPALVRQNPFCLPNVAAVDSSKVQLASGDARSTVVLKSVRREIGTLSIDPIVDRDRPLSVSAAAEKPPVIQVNPLVEVEAHSGRDAEPLVSAPIEVIKPSSVAKTSRRSSIILVPRNQTVVAEAAVEPLVAHEVPFARQVPADLLAAEPVNDGLAIVATDKSLASGTGDSDTGDSDTKELSSATNEETSDEPIFFTFSDWEEDDDDPEQDLPTGTDHGDAAAAEITEEHDSAAVITAESTLGEQLRAAAEPVEAIQLFKAASTDLKKISPIKIDEVPQAGEIRRNDQAVSVAEPIGKLVDPGEPTLHSQRYRPPVAVHSVSLDLDEESPSASVVLSPEIELEDPTSNSAQEGEEAAKVARPQKLKIRATPLYLNLAQVRSLTLGAEVSGVKVIDQEVCQAVAVAPNRIKLIGTGNGVTQLVVWAKPESADAKARIRAFEVHVQDVQDQQESSTDKKLVVLNESIANAFPNSDVSVAAGQGELIVAGSCGSEVDAKKIIRMVRKTVLLPIRDNLQVR